MLKKKIFNCESICSWKFHKDGKPIKKIEDSGDFESDKDGKPIKKEEKDDSWYDKIAKRDFERCIYEECDQEDEEERLKNDKGDKND